MGMIIAVSRGWQRVVNFFRRQGTAVVTTVCVGVITAAALWYPQVREEAALPSPGEDQAAARLVQQTLPPAAAAPPASPAPFVPPLADLQALQPFAPDTMVQDPLTGIWRIHDAALLAGQPGEDVRALADGVVQSCASDGCGNWRVVLALPDGITAEYALLAETPLAAGESVRAGEVIGRLGHGGGAYPLPCLRLRITRDGKAADPLAFFSVLN